MNEYDLQKKFFTAGTVPVVVIGTVPLKYTCIITYVEYTLGGQSGTVVGKLVERRLGILAEPVSIVTLNPANPNYHIGGRKDDVVGVVRPGYELVALSEAGTVSGVVIYRFVPGRVST
ncbi:MAG: hypothetical protein QXL22_01005 [Candidatus Nezhaarchaeales archaeon]